MKTTLIVVTLVEVALLVVVLAVYLLAIAAKLRSISKTLGLVTFGVRAIDKQTQPIGPVLRDINGALEEVAGALERVTADVKEDAPAESVKPILSPATGIDQSAGELGK